MKRLLFAATATLVSMTMVADPIDADKAKSIAQEYMIPGHTMTLVKSAKRNVSKAKRLSQSVASTSPYYIYSRGEGKGFVIVAGDDCIPTIIGYTEQGDWDDSTVPEALSDMLTYYAESVENAQVNGTNSSIANEVRQRRASSTKVDIAPLVSAHWHQSTPYNDNCPRLTSNGNLAATGCVATAASQILYYWRKDLPSTLQASTPTYGYGDAPVTRSVPKGTPLKWDLMKDSYSGSEPSEYKEAVAEFVFATGAATWLTYGSSTSGNIEKIPYTFSTYYGMNGGTVHYRASYSQTAWSNLLYEELINGRPVMYTGVHPSNGGHAVFVHGYKASSDLFYFNFGWGAGNGYDGYYTTSQTDGMNGFYDSQSALIGAYPKTWNMNVEISYDDVVKAYSYNDFNVHIENNSTLPLTGVYLFVSTSKTKPTKIASAAASDATANIESGSEGTFKFSAKINSERTYYIYVTDADLNVLAQSEVTSVYVNHDLTFNKFVVNGSTDKINAGDHEYSVVYNTNKASLSFNVTNNSNYSYNGVLRYRLMSSTDGVNWDEGTTNSVSGVVLDASSTTDYPFVITALNTDTYYKAVVEKSSSTTLGKYEFVYDEQTDTVAYFVLKGSDLTVESFDNNVIKCAGHWDYATFNSTTILTNSKYKTHTSIDLTNVTGVSNVPDDNVNPNALYYVADDSESKGKNIVKAGVCESLSLTPGYDFVPMSDFTAESAEITIGDNAAQWYLLTVPFDAKIHNGVIARSVDGHSTLGINNKTTDCSVLEAGKTYLVMTTSVDNNKLFGENANVSAVVKANPDTAIVGTYVNTTTPEGALLVNDDEVQYFVPVDEGTSVEALRGYFYDSKIKNKFRAYSMLLLDPAYLTLAININNAWEVLEEYKGITTQAAYDGLHAAIKDAEKEFTNREESTLTNATSIKNYAASLLELTEEYKRTVNANQSVNIDYTSYISNPSFELSNGSTTGWTIGKTVKGDAGTTVAKARSNSTLTYYASGVDGSYLLYNYYVYTNSETNENDTLGVEISQTVSGLVPGCYRVSALLGSSEGNSITLYAGDKETTVAAHAFGVHYLTEAVVDSVYVLADEGSDTGSLVIGVKSGSWYKADDFKLTLLEASQDAIPTSISDVAQDDEIRYQNDGDIYSIHGVKVNDMSKSGMYIKNGRKIVVQ